MNNSIKNVIVFLLGATIGSIVTWKLVETKYKQLAQEEIDSVKNAFQDKEIDGPDSNDESEEEEERPTFTASQKPDLDEYVSLLKRGGYVKTDEKRIDKPYVITPESYGEFDEYELISLTYYADKILADDGDELVEDIDNVVGFDSLTRFGEYAEDCVYVRNDRLKCDYEILMDLRTYVDVIKNLPYPTED